MKKRKILSIITAGLLAVSMVVILAACGGSKAPADNPQPAGSGSGTQTAGTASDMDACIAKGKIVVGVTDFAPMDYKENGKWVGFDADLATLFAKEMGIDVEFIEIDWDTKILELNAGTVDCVWNGMTLTSEVAEAMSCSDTYAINAQVVVLPKDKLGDYKDVASLKDLSFAVEAGSAGEKVGTEAKLKVNAVQNQAAALMEVAAGTSDACIIDKTMADAMTGEGTSYADLGYSLALSEEEYVVGFRKGSDLLAPANNWLKTWKEDGTLKSLSEKYDNAVSLVE